MQSTRVVLTLIVDLDTPHQVHNWVQRLEKYIQADPELVEPIVETDVQVNRIENPARVSIDEVMPKEEHEVLRRLPEGG